MLETLRQTFSQKKIDWVLVGIIGIALGLRLYRIREMAIFDFDQEYAVNFAWQVWYVYPLQMVGQGLSVMGLFMGPWYFYFLTPFVWLAGFDPVGGIVGSVMLGMIVLVAYYWLAKQFWGRAAGLAAAWLKAVVLIELEHDWTMAPAYQSELAVLALWYWLYLYWENRKPGWWWLGLILGMFFSFHPIQFVFYPIVLLVVLMKRQWPTWRQLSVAVLCLLLPLWSWLLFEYFRNWAQIRQIWGMFVDGSHSGAGQGISWGVLLSVAIARVQDVWGWWRLPQWLVGGLWLGIFLWVSIGRWRKSVHYVLLPLAVVTSIAYYTLFPTHVPEYYIHGVATLLLLYSAALMVSLRRWIGLWVVGIWLVLVGVFHLRELRSRFWNNGDLIALAHKQQVMTDIMAHQPEGKPFYVSYITRPGMGWGFEYLWKVAERQPAPLAEGNDVYTVVIPWDLSEGSIDKRFGGIGLIYPDMVSVESD